MDTHAEYWARRAAEQTYDYMERAEQVASDVARLYRNASDWTAEQTGKVFARFARKYGLTEKEAMKVLSNTRGRAELERIKAALALVHGDGARELEMLLEAPAFRARIERLNDVMQQLDGIVERIYGQELNASTELYRQIGKDAYYRGIYEIHKRSGIGVSFSHVSEKELDRVLHMKWSGENYSQRIWDNTQELCDRVKEEILLDVVMGKTNRESAKALERHFAKGAMQCRRLMRTESCFVAGELNARAYQETGVEKYRYVATLDLITSQICRSLDGKVFLLSERKAGTNYPPMHPWCRSTTIAELPASVLASMNRRGIDPATGRPVLIPATMNYTDWYEKYVKGKPEAEAKERAVKERLRKQNGNDG